MRVRGLKQQVYMVMKEQVWSHPMRVRWIETGNAQAALNTWSVAPHAGAWIETCQEGGYI